MTSLRIPLAVLLILSVIAFFADPLSAIIGPLEYTGSLGYTYVEGENPIVQVVFLFEDEIGKQLLVTYAPPQWSWTQGGNSLTMTGGSLQPGDTLVVQVSFRKFVPPGEKLFQATGTTSAGEETTAYGVLVVSLMILLQVFAFLAVNRYIILGVTLGLGVIEAWLSWRGLGIVIAAPPRPADCKELIEKCEKAKEEAEAAEAEAKAAKQKAEAASQEHEDAEKAVQDAEKKLRDAKKKAEDKSEAWIEIDGRRITSMDLKLRKDAAKELWDQYRQGELDAETLEGEWEKLGEHNALEELRKQRKEAQTGPAEKALVDAKNKSKEAAEKAENTQKEAKAAREKASEAKAYANKICKEAEECKKAQAKTLEKPPVVKEDETPEEEPETTEETTYETTETTQTTETTTGTYETTTYTTEETKPSPGRPTGGTRIFGPRLGETGLVPTTPKKPDEPSTTASEEEEESKVKRCGPDVTGIYLKALNTIASRLRSEYRDAPAGSWTDFPGARQAYGIKFLAANGYNMDFWPHTPNNCPNCPECLHTVTLLGECIVAHTLNDLIYGICAGFFGVPETIQKAGGHAAQILSYGSLDPEVSQEIYKSGTELGEMIRKPVEFCKDDLDFSVLEIDAIKRTDCTPCTTPATGTVSDRNFSRKKWIWL